MGKIPYRFPSIQAVVGQIRCLEIISNYGGVLNRRCLGVKLILRMLCIDLGIKGFTRSIPEGIERRNYSITKKRRWSSLRQRRESVLNKPESEEKYHQKISKKKRYRRRTRFI